MPSLGKNNLSMSLAICGRGMTCVMFSRLLNSQSLFIEMTKPESNEILNKMSAKGYVVPAELISGAKDQRNMKKVLTGMIRADLMYMGV